MRRRWGWQMTWDDHGTFMAHSWHIHGTFMAPHAGIPLSCMRDLVLGRQASTNGQTRGRWLSMEKWICPLSFLSTTKLGLHQLPKVAVLVGTDLWFDYFDLRICRIEKTEQTELDVILFHSFAAQQFGVFCDDHWALCWGEPLQPAQSQQQPVLWGVTTSPLHCAQRYSLFCNFSKRSQTCRMIYVSTIHRVWKTSHSYTSVFPWSQQEYLISWPPPPFNPSEDNQRLQTLKMTGEAGLRGVPSGDQIAMLSTLTWGNVDASTIQRNATFVHTFVKLHKWYVYSDKV